MCATIAEFPAGFRWGVATAAHQVEGETRNNQWYHWEELGHIKSGDHLGIACDWWHHAESDFDRAQAMHLNALRLSVEWSRIEPQPDVWDEAAVDRYRQMLTGLHARGLEPMVTLHHFTHPRWIEERGGWLAEESVARFTRFVEYAVRKLGDLCDLWCTINEPNIVAVMGYQIGDFPPGRRGDIQGYIRAQVHMIKAHAAAYHAIHTIQPAARVGWAQHYNVFDPARPKNLLDQIVAGQQDVALNEFFPAAVLTGHAPGVLRALAGDLRVARGTCDFVGINAYARNTVRFDITNPLELFGRRGIAPGAPQGDVGVEPLYGEMYPQGLVRLIRRTARFGKPIYITENGIADRTDRLRPWIIVTAVRAIQQALSEGYDVRGYYHWTLVDNFEWAEGWGMAFGLIAMDHTTQVRTPRPSADLYSAIAARNGLTDELANQYAVDISTPLP